ncbi:MAG TPA: histidine phosphatase family protein [Polyangiaceae bacterium]|nr:histidine phosphatase family protein [Polyangiaceae bacterium]
MALSTAFPVLYLARHGETEWSKAGRHTGRADLELTEHGQEQARRLGVRLGGRSFAQVFSSPLRRARHTCELAGHGPGASIDEDLLEWDYGAYEGRRNSEIRAERPDWDLFRDGCPGGETPDEVAARADRVVERVRAVAGDVLVFSSAHLLRVLAVRWLRRPVDVARHLLLAPASLSALGYEHDLSEPAIVSWNETSHLVTATS